MFHNHNYWRTTTHIKLRLELNGFHYCQKMMIDLGA